MPGFLKQSTAAQARAIGPFISDSDFKTVQTGLTIANTDIKLIINGAASVNKNSGGGTHRANGDYGVTFDATDTATVGEIKVSVSVSGALVVFDKFIVLTAAVYDELFGASAIGYISGAKVDVDTIKTNPVINGGTATFPSNATLASTTNITAATGIDLTKILGTSLTETVGGYLAAAFKKLFDVTTPVLTAASVNQTGDSFGRIGAAGASLTAVAIGTGGISTLSFAAGAIDAAAIATDAIGSAEMSSGASNKIADALLDRTDGIETSLTFRQAMRLGMSALFGKLSGAGTTTVVIRNYGDSKDRITATVDASGNRSAVTTDAT